MDAEEADGCGQSNGEGRLCCGCTGRPLTEGRLQGPPPRMNSLVAYEDSDSDTDGPETSVAERRTAHARTSGTSHDLILRPPPATSCTGARAACQDSDPRIRDRRIMGFPQSFSQSETKYRDSTQKRRAAGGEVVRPYVPKRLRQAQAQLAEGLESDMVERQSPDCTDPPPRSVYRVSDYLGPHLSMKYGETEVPRNVVFQMAAHAGPVNRVQWCPVRQHSHLLLSASMDASIKVWDGVDNGKCLRTISSHRLAVRDAQWSLCGQKILSGGFDSNLHLTDVETGKDLFSAKNDWRIGAVRFHPGDPNLFICGGFSPAVKAWDVRTAKAIHTYKAAVQQHFDVLFLRAGNEFLSTTDSVSRDSADRTIIAWDFATTAKISNQIFHERYTCPSLAQHPRENVFIAQTNGNYMALFSSQRPYKMNKRKRYEGHKVEGFAVGCEFSPDGSLLVTGSADGSVYFYNYHTAKIIRSLPGDGNACVSVTYHPVLPSLLATAYWDGQIRIWQ